MLYAFSNGRNRVKLNLDDTFIIKDGKEELIFHLSAGEGTCCVLSVCVRAIHPSINCTQQAARAHAADAARSITQPVAALRQVLAGPMPCH